MSVLILTPLVRCHSEPASAARNLRVWSLRCAIAIQNLLRIIVLHPG
jgi:hypothetical protein